MYRGKATAIGLVVMGLLYGGGYSKQKSHNGAEEGVEMYDLIEIVDPFRMNGTYSITERFRTEKLLLEWENRRRLRFSSENQSKYSHGFVSRMKDALAHGDFFVNDVGCAFPPGPILQDHSIAMEFIDFLQDTLLGGYDNPSQREAAKVVIWHDLLNFWALKNRSKVFGASTEEEEKNYAPSSLLQNLERDGYAKISSWGLSPGFMQKLQKEVKEVTKSQGGKTRYVMASTKELKSLTNDVEGQNLMRRGILPTIARRYLGQRAILSGYVALRLDPGISAKKYISSLWHHDRCGRRLKAFLFLHDITEHHQPTEVAVGSHRTLFYSYHNLAESRYNNSWVRTNYHVEQMIGPENGGFVFDTNSIHRGGGPTAPSDDFIRTDAHYEDNTKTRIVLIFEINDLPKSHDFHNISSVIQYSDTYEKTQTSYNVKPPCPSGLFRLDWRLASDPSTGEKIFRPSHRHLREAPHHTY